MSSNKHQNSNHYQHNKNSSKGSRSLDIHTLFKPSQRHESQKQPEPSSSSSSSTQNNTSDSVPPSFHPPPPNHSPQRKQRASVQHEPRFRIYETPPQWNHQHNHRESPTHHFHTSTSPHHFFPQWFKKFTNHHHHHRNTSSPNEFEPHHHHGHPHDMSSYSYPPTPHRMEMSHPFSPTITSPTPELLTPHSTSPHHQKGKNMNNNLFLVRANQLSHHPASIEMYHEEDLHPYPLTPTNIKNPPFETLQLHHQKLSSSLHQHSPTEQHHHEEDDLNSPISPTSSPLFNTNPDSPNQTLRRIITRFQHLFKSNTHPKAHEGGNGGFQHQQHHPHMKILPKLEVNFSHSEKDHPKSPTEAEAHAHEITSNNHQTEFNKKIISPQTPTSLVPSLLHPHLSPLSKVQAKPKHQHPQEDHPSRERSSLVEQQQQQQQTLHLQHQKRHEAQKQAVLASLDTSQLVNTNTPHHDNVSLSEPTSVHHHHNLLSVLSPVSPQIHQPPHHHHRMDYFDSEPYPRPTAAQLHHPLHALHPRHTHHHGHPIHVSPQSPHHQHHHHPNHTGSIIEKEKSKKQPLVEESAKALEHPKKYSNQPPQRHHRFHRAEPKSNHQKIPIPTTDIVVCTQSSSLPTQEENTSSAHKSAQQQFTQTFFRRTSSDNLTPVSVSWNIQQPLNKNNSNNTNDTMNIPKKTTSQDDFYMEDSSLPESNVHAITQKPSRTTHIMSDEDGVIISSSPTSKPRVTTGQIQEEILDPIFDFFKTNTNYDLMPYSGKVIVFDIDLPVREAFQVAANNDISFASLWDSEKSCLVGMLTVTDLIDILLLFHNQMDVIQDLVTHKTIREWRAMQKRTRPDKLIYVTPEDTLLTSIHTLSKYSIHRLPVLSPKGALLHIITHSHLLAYLVQNLKFESPIFQYSLEDLGIGTYVNVVTAKMEMQLFAAVCLFAKYKVSAIPVVNDEGCVVDVFSRYDIVYFVRDGDYRLEMTLGEALKTRPRIPVFTCTKSESFEKVLRHLSTTRIHRLVCVDEYSRVVGIVSISDIFSFLMKKQEEILSREHDIELLHGADMVDEK